MKLHQLLCGAAVAAVLAGCSGGGGTGPNVTPNTPNAPTAPQSGARGSLAVRVDMPTAKASSNGRAVKQITASVDTVDVIIDTVDNNVALSACPSSVCTLAVGAGNHSISVTVKHGSTALGVSVAQTLAVTGGVTTSATYTITPIVNSVSVTSDAVRFPEDAASHVANLTVAALDPLGNALSTPLDPAVFGTVSLGSTAGNVSNPGPVGVTNATFSYPATTLTYTGNAVTGDAITITPTYTNAGTYTFPGTRTAATILLSKLTYATGSVTSTDGSSSFNGTGTVTFTGYGTFNGLTFAQANAGAQATGATTSSAINFAAPTSNACNGNVTVAPAGSSTITSGTLSQAFNITVAAGATTCFVTFYTADWGSNSITKSLQIVPPGAVAITVQDKKRVTH